MIYLLRRFSAVSCIMLSACAAAGGGLAGGPTPAGTAYGAFLAARYADAQQDPAAAVKFYGQALAAEPDNKALINEGFLAAAVSGSPQAPQLARQISSNALAMMMLGNQAAMDGDFTAAGAQFARLPGQDLSGLLSPLLIAWADCGAGNPQAALALLQPLITGNSAFAGIYRLNAALIADQNHDMKDASVYYGNTANIGDAPNLRLAQIVASWQARQGNLDAARAVLAQMAATHPGLAPALPGLQAQMAAPVIRNPADGLAEAYLTVAGSLNLPDQSILRLTFLRFAITLRPDLSAARLLLASALTATDAANPKAPPPSQGALRQALDVLQPVAPTDPLYSTAVLQEADLMSSLHEAPQAVSLLDKLLANDPKNLDALEEAGDILRASNQYAAAIGYYSRALATLPAPAPAAAWVLYYDRGISIYQSGGDWAKAEADLQAALKLSPDQPYVLNYLGYSWALRNENLARARAMLTQAVSMAPKEGAIIDSLGFVNMRIGDTSEAVTLLTQAVELDPDDAEVNAHLGDAFYANGQKLQADYQWRRALALQPDAKLQAAIEAKLKQLNPPA